MVLSLAINVSVKGGTEKSENPQLKEQIEKASKPIGWVISSANWFAAGIKTKRSC